MKHGIILALLGFSLASTVLASWAEDCVPVNHLGLLYLPGNKVIADIETATPIIVENRDNLGYSGIVLHNVCPMTAWVDKTGLLRAKAYIRKAPFEVQTLPLPTGIWLQFRAETSLQISVKTSAQAFLERVAEDLPVYLPETPALAPSPAEADQGALLKQAEQDFRAHKTEETAEALTQAFNQLAHPQVGLYQLLGAVYLQEQDWVRALYLYAQGAKRYPTQLDLRYGALLYQAQQPDKAIQVLSDLMHVPGATSGTVAEARYMLGTMQAEHHHYDDALPNLEHAMKDYPNSPVILFNLAITYEGLNRPEDALQTYRSALSLAKGPLKNDIQTQINRLDRVPPVPESQGATP